ncbi:hypothetical protein [Amycolatopsis marina]|nr:hypothetical protein [Amycolatopsis marina]
MTGGGAATNSGIDFQARVGALALVSMLTDVADLGSFGLGQDGDVPLEVHFETADAVDDIALVLPRGRILIQAKNTVTLSSSVDSELGKVIRQIVAAYHEHRESGQYILAVSPFASARIRQDLKKLCNSYRLNQAGHSSNPLNQRENETLKAIREHIFREYEVISGSRCDVDIFVAILKATHIETLDIGENSIGERMAVTALSTVTDSEPMVMWRGLVATCLTLARNRMSIDQAGLTARFGALLPVKRSRSDSFPRPDDHQPALTLEGKVSMGREVVLGEDEDGRTYLAELRRFDDDGTRRVRFTGGFVDLSGGVRWRVLRRTATYSGMARELEDELATQISGEIVVIDADFGDIDDTPFAQAHAAGYQAVIEAATDPLTCLVCGCTISQDRAHSVEVDDVDHPYQVGLVHRHCLRPMHRIIGVVKAEAFAATPSLIDFDYKTWINQMRGGQGIWRSSRGSGNAGLLRVGWNPRNSGGTTGGWAVEYDLSDGTSRYVLVRGRVHRGNRRQAQQMAGQLSSSASEAAIKGDPMVYGLRGYSKRSIAVCADDPNPPEVVTHRAVQITEATVSAHSTSENYYAPLFYLSDHETGELFTMGEAPVLLTDPLRFEDVVANWCLAGVELPALISTTIVPTDHDFDLFMMRADSEGRAACVDPILEPVGGLISGFLVANFNEITKK